MKTIFWIGLLGLTTLCSGLCPSYWKQIGEYCYLIFNQKSNWTVANNVCHYHGAKLATPEEEARHIYIKALMIMTKQTEDVWLGASDTGTEGRWVWTGTDHVLTYSKWQVGDPDNFNGENCMAMTASTHEWNDNRCSSELPFVCQADAWSSC